MSAAVACGENSVLDTSRNGIDVEADGSMSSIEDGGEIFPPFSRIDVTSILSPPLIKVEDDNDDHDNETLRAHKRLVHAGEEHKCTICFQKFLSKHMLTYHLSREHVGQSRFTCDICTRKFGYEDIFMNHCRQHNGSKPFYCPLCNTWFCDLVDLNSHAQEFQVRDPIHCSVCGQRTARKYKLLLEKLSGTIFKKLSKKCLTVLYYCEQCQPKDTHDCAVCGRIFVHPGYLRQHYNSSHRSVEPFKCGECFASFTSRCILERHLETHPGRQRPWVCPFCGLRFQLQSSYMSHLQDHKALKPYSCSICGENFNIEKKLNVHITEHHTIGENESSSCSVISSSAVSDGRNDCLNGEYETSVSNDICLGDTQDVSDSERHVINTSAQKRYKSCAVSFMQKETLSNAQECTSNILGGGLKLNRDSIDTVLQNSNPTHSLQYVKQEVLYDDCDCTTIQEYRNSDVNKDYSKHTVSNTSNHTENRENIFSFDYVKEEVFTPDVCANVQEDRNVNKSVDSCQTECSIPLENSAANCAVYFIKKEVVQNVDNVPSREHFDLTSPGSTNATMLCSDFNSRQQNENDNPGFSLSCLKTETVSEEENNTTFKSFTLNQERQNSMQHQGDEYFYHVGVKEELCSGEGRDGDIASGEEEDEEFCPLDLLSTELTLRNEESPDAENSNSLNECNEKMRLLISDVKSVPSENHSPTCEADMENECSDEEGRDEIEFKTSTSPKLQTCEFGPVAESSSAEPSKQFSISRLDQKIPMEVQLPQIPALPAMSPDSTGLDSFQRLPSENNFYSAVERRHKCCFCEELMESSISLRQHYRTVHHGEPHHLCLICRKRFNRRSDFLKHTSHAHKTNMRCTLCDKKFMKQQALKLHYHHHLSKSPYLCIPCQTWFRDLDELESHRASTRPFEELHYCGRCGRKNAWKFKLAHFDQGKAYLCDSCEQSLYKKMNTCEGCGRFFRSAALLEAHYIREHTGIYQCSTCCLFFDTKCILFAHVETVCGTLKVSTCSACGRRFQSLDALQQHELDHYSLLHPQRTLLPR